MQPTEHYHMAIRLFAQRHGGRVGHILALAALTVMPLVACDTNRLLSVSDPDVARPAVLTDASALPALYAGAVGQFGLAFDGNNVGFDVEQVTQSALLSDEFINTETFPTRIEIDRRAQKVTNSSLAEAFLDLNQARSLAERAVSGVRSFAKTSVDSAGYPEELSLAGLTYVLFAENYCAAVPVSIPNDNGSGFTFGQPLNTNQQLDSAIARFNVALSVTGDPQTSTTLNLAKVAKGRALLDKGDFAGAAAAVAGVPTTFQYNSQHSTTTTLQNTGTWELTIDVGRFGVADREGGNGLPFQSDGNVAGSVGDPRVPNEVRPTSKGHGFDGGPELQFVQLKYPDRASSSTIADGVEARLIEAEAALHGGDAVGALAILNALRSNTALLGLRGYDAAGLPPLTLQATTDAQVDQLFKERAYWMYLTSHRLGDLRRLIRQYGRSAESVFPTGPYFKGGNYGTDVNSPVPQAEQNNPNFKAASCVQSQP
jgi:hypothetical protein